MLISQGLYEKPAPFLLPLQVKASCVSGLLTPANNCLKILKNVLTLGLDLRKKKKKALLFHFGVFCLFVSVF